MRYAPCDHPFYAVIHDYDYVFSENGFLAHKNGEVIGRQVIASSMLYFICMDKLQRSSFIFVIKISGEQNLDMINCRKIDFLLNKGELKWKADNCI